MEVRRTYDLSVPVEFKATEGVNPFYWDDDGKKTWRLEGIYSAITTEDDIWDHLAYNCIVNGVEDASRLDGWADLERGQLTMRMDRSDLTIEIS